MKAIKKLVLTALTLAALAAGAWAQNDAAPRPAAKKKHGTVAASPTQPAVTAADFQTLKDGLAVAEQRIQALQEELRHRDQDVQQAQSVAAAAAAKADATQLRAVQQEQTVDVLKSDIAGLKSVNATSLSTPAFKNAVLSLQDPVSAANSAGGEIFNKQMESPITIRFRGINITPGGYAAGEFVRRSHALSADVATPFNSVPLPGASQSQLSEFFGSGRQSKITTFVDGRMGNVDLSSYVSADFLSAGVTSNSNSTNSYTLRVRQAWAQAKFQNGFSFTGGQMWSLITENSKGITVDDDMGKTNDARPKTIDSTYNVGFNFARQYALRVAKTFDDKIAVGFSIENAQATITTHGNASNYLLGNSGASNSYNTTTTYSFNPAPDVIAKVAFDPGFGHYEVFGLLSRFTDRVFPCVEHATGSTLCGSNTATGAFNASKEGGGVGASARWNFAKRVTFGLKGTGGSGIGRYAGGGLSDASINPDGTLHLIKNLQGLGTLELHANKKLDIYSYGGVEYAGRSWGIDKIPTTPVIVGYGAPGFNNTGCYTEVAPGSGGFTPGALSKCTGDTRALIEGTLGFWYRFYSGPKGSFRYGTQFSYVSRNTWSGVGGQPGGIDSMVFSSFRYYLP